MIVRVTARRNHEDDADDVLAGWGEMSNFIFGYITQQSSSVEIVALFDCLEGPLERGQRLVLDWKKGRTRR